MKKNLTIVLATLVFVVFMSGMANAIPTTLIDQGSTWQYSVLTTDLWPTWDTASYASFNWSTATWSDGTAAFGNTDNPSYPLDYNTYWAANTDLALQKTFMIDGDLSAPIILNVASDNGFMVFINGTQVAKENAEGYTSYWEYNFNPSESNFISPGNNLIQVLAEDHGSITFFDLRLTGDVTAAPVPEPATLLLLGSGLLGLAGFRKKISR